jgi:hypothetical protein
VAQLVVGRPVEQTSVPDGSARGMIEARYRVDPPDCYY